MNVENDLENEDEMLSVAIKRKSGKIEEFFASEDSISINISFLQPSKHDDLIGLHLMSKPADFEEMQEIQQKKIKTKCLFCNRQIEINYVFLNESGVICKCGADNFLDIDLDYDDIEKDSPLIKENKIKHEVLIKGINLPPNSEQNDDANSEQNDDEILYQIAIFPLSEAEMLEFLDFHEIHLIHKNLNGKELIDDEITELEQINAKINKAIKIGENARKIKVSY